MRGGVSSRGGHRPAVFQEDSVRRLQKIHFPRENQESTPPCGIPAEPKQSLQGEGKTCKVRSMTAVTETYRYIARSPGVRGGKALPEGTRIGVHDVVGLLQNGETIDSLPRCLAGISRAQVYECLAYYEDHRGEIDHLIASQMAGPTP